MKNNGIIAKLGITVLMFFCLSTSTLFSQGNRYSISAGTNVSWVSRFSLVEETTSYWRDTAYTIKVVYSSKPNFGYYLNNDFSLAIQKKISFKTGFGISWNSAQLHTNIKDTLHTSTSHINSYQHIQNGRQDIDVTSISIPMQVELDFFKKQLFVSLGLMINIPIQIGFWGNFDDILMNGRLGVEYQIYKNLHISGYYEPSISKSRNNDRFIDPEFDAGYTKKFYMNSVSFGLSYKLK